ncbi:MAG: TFIIB-type zinc ribbon-containing protein [Ruminococcaceae bacterium]|nr:TFIIB-type zinc ribbon-containing protein [Oscillospiraceae bacterium]
MDAVQYKCPNCGGGLKFDAAKQDFICEYCDSVFKEEDFFAKDETLENESPEQKAVEQQEYENAVLYVCPSCGAQVITDETTAATTCYYCSNPVVLSGRLSGELKPDMIIPFKIDKKSAVQKFKDMCSKKKFLPKNFVSESRLEEIKGIYFPYWYVDCETSGSINATSRQVKTWVVGDVQHTETTVRSHFRAGDMMVRNMPESALRGKDKDIMRYVCPFNGADFVPFSMSYLSGYFAEKRNIETNEIASGVTQKIKHFSEEKLEKSIDAVNVTLKDSSINVGELRWSYNLLPVWVLNYKHKDKNYIYALNGQTGKVYGELPVCGKKLAMLFAGVAAGVSVILTVAGGLLF